MIRKLIIIFMSLSLFWTVAPYGSSSALPTQLNLDNSYIAAKPSDRIPAGKYPIQQANYDDATGEYSLMLLNTPADTSPVFSTIDLQMARLTDEQIENGEKTYLEVDGDKAAMYMTEDFRIEYTHNVTETVRDPETGQQQTVVVRRESNFWTPFAGAIAGQMVGNLLFGPRYYVPPIYQPGIPLTGYGGYGNTYGQAVKQYRKQYKSPPAAVKNRRNLRTTGSLNRTSTRRSSNLRKNTSRGSKSTGSGFGSSNLRSSSKSTAKSFNRRGSFGSSFGGSRRSSFSSPRRSFSGGRRRR